MKKITCREIDGICDTFIEGNSFQEMLVNRQWHLKQSVDIYPEHREVLKKMEFWSDDEKARWEEDLLTKWNALPE